MRQAPWIYIVICVATLWIVGCSLPDFSRNPANSLQDRSGLATGWGRDRAFGVVPASFERASERPAGTDTIYYNDAAGISSFRNSLGSASALEQAAGGLVEWGIRGTSGYLKTYRDRSTGRRYVEGRKGAEYAIVVKNRSRSSLEIVASVDGLDVMDGRPASVGKGGYVVEPGRTLEIKGYRTSMDRVAGFEFSTVAESYAGRKGDDTRNIGVVGIAVFTRKGVDPWGGMTDEDRRRGKARAFAEAPWD